MSEKIPIKTVLADKHDKWRRIRSMVRHNEEAFREKPFCIRLPNEQPFAYRERKEHFATGFINISQDLISAPGNVIYKGNINHGFHNESSLLSTFSANSTLGNEKMPFLRYLKDYVAISLRSYGNIFTVIDKPDGEVRNRADERARGMPYLSNINPLDVQNYETDGGELLWFAYRKWNRDKWIDPRHPAPDGEERIAVWEKDWYFEQDASSGDIVKEYKHGWGIVPVVMQGAFLPQPSDIIGVSAFEQTSNMIIMFNTHLHISNYEIMKHGSSLLLLHQEAVDASNQGIDSDGNSEIKKQDKGTALVWGGDNEPKYLVKDLAVESSMELAQFYLKSAVENERDLKTIAKKGTSGQDVAESGFAKMLNREPMEANLLSLAEDLEYYANRVYGTVAKILGVKDDHFLEFEKSFDLRTFEQKLKEVKLATEAKMANVTPTGYKELWKGMTPELTNEPDVVEAINGEIDNADVEPDSFLDRMLSEEETGET